MAVVTPPPQLKVAPLVVDEAVKVSVVVVQVKAAGAAILALGATIFCITATDADAVQLLDGSVTITVYGPGAETLFVIVVTPPPQLNVAPLVVDAAVNVVDVTAQVNVAGVPILAFGGLTVCVTVTAAVVVQPLDGSVTVTVYVAGLVTIWLAVVIPPPQLNVAPLVVDEAASTSLVAVQVKTEGGAMLALGAVIF